MMDYMYVCTYIYDIEWYKYNRVASSETVVFDES